MRLHQRLVKEFKEDPKNNDRYIWGIVWGGIETMGWNIRWLDKKQEKYGSAVGLQLEELRTLRDMIDTVLEDSEN